VQQDNETAAGPQVPHVTLWDLAQYFLYLGSLGFGGPMALAAYMKTDLVEKRRWLSEDEYHEGLAIATAMPGPLAYQLAVYVGWVRCGFIGGIVVGAAFIVTPVLLCLITAYLYVHYAGLWQVRALFYGITPVVIAIILMACYKVGKPLVRDTKAWLIFLVCAVVTYIYEAELVALFLGAGIAGIVFYAMPLHEWRRRFFARFGTFALLPALLSPTPSPLEAVPLQLFLFFFKAAFFIFGSGLVLVPFLREGIVVQFGWLELQPFLDAVAMGLITPGPVVVTAVFVGYVVAGWSGALFSTVGMFTPSIVLTYVGAPIMRRYRDSPVLKGFIRGITAAVVGVIFGTTMLLIRDVIRDWFTATVGVVGLIAMLRFRIPDPILVLAGALLGLALFRYLDPQWILAR
jgi:chromate transporter